MRIGIVGGGAAGLVTAWLLDAEHEVTLFEKEDRLGGHAHTVEVEVDGERIAVDAGFQFFSAGAAYATFNRLLDALEVPRRSYPATITVFHTARPGSVALPPLRRGGPVWDSLGPRGIETMIRFRTFLAGVPAFLAQHDTTVTIDDYLERERLPRWFVDEFLYPLLLSFWCVDPDRFGRFAAYNALFYLGANLPAGLRAPDQSEIPGGMRVYVDALAKQLDRTRIRLNSAIRAVAQSDDGLVVLDAHGDRHVFDQLVLATSAEQASELIGPLPALGSMREQLGRFDYFDTTIAIHGDRRLMPRTRSAWSVVNARWDGAHSALSIWDPARGLPVFKSWVTFDQALPDPLYATVRYRHGAVDTQYFDAQRRLGPLQGEGGVWLAGLYADDADSHESAVRSAVHIAERLAPASARLRLIASGDGSRVA